MPIFEKVRELAMQGNVMIFEKGVRYKSEQFEYNVTITTATLIERVFIHNSPLSMMPHTYTNFVTWQAGQSVYCPSRKIQKGHNAIIGKLIVADDVVISPFLVLSDGRVFVRLDFQIINPMSAWCRIEDVLAC